MAKQTLVFVVLPNGITTKGTLRLSIYVVPRLEQGPTLAAFPDMLDWTSRIKQHGLKLELSCAGNLTTVAADKSVLRPDVWSAIFPSSAFVEDFKLPDFDQRLIVSYPVRSAMSYMKWAWQTIGTGSAAGGEGNLRPLEVVLGDLVFRDGTESTLAGALAEMRRTMWHEQQSFRNPGEGGISVGVATAGIMGPVPPDGVATTLTQPTNTRDTVTRLALFHSLPPAPGAPPLPSSEDDFKKTLDFHRALTALHSYPSLQRALGLVFDVEVPGSFCPDSPGGGAYGSIELTKVTAGFKWSINPTFSFPATAYIRDKASFFAAPASAPGATTILAGDIVKGFLALTGSSFHLLQVDADGGLLKALTLADNVAYARDAEVVGDELPSLRSGGIGLVAEGRGLQLLQSIVDNKGFDQALTTNNAMPRPFNARDLTRGFRVDIWSSRTKQWYSLHRRNSIYRFGASGSIAIPIEDEEGFLQPAAAQPADDPTRSPDPQPTGDTTPQSGTDIYVHERLARWDGWSLSASRPGIALNRSPNPADATTPDPTLNQPMTPFKMKTDFKAHPGSLPELRFGLKYRLRARAVDLAGNSLSLSDATPTDTLILPANGALLPYLRFEPVNPPLVVLQQPPQAGASLERMVIRTFNTDPSLDTVPTALTDARHIAPPRASERLAEHHGLFDNASGKLNGGSATFNLMTTRDKFDFPQQDGVPIDPSPLVSVGYLPDPLSRGAALRDLPGGPDDTNGRILSNALTYKTLPDVQPRPGSVTFIDFNGTWPDPEPFLVTIGEGNVAPRWDPSKRVLAVALPKSSVASVELSSYVNEGDLMIMGVWTWLREYFTARELQAIQGGFADTMLTWSSDIVALLTRLVLEGGHEMITPSRTLVMVHAVQQPLGRPQFVQLPVVHLPADIIYASALRNSFTPITAWRSVGSHNAVLLGALKIHGASSVQIDLEARWLEYEDDLTNPGPTKTWNSNHVETILLPDTSAGVLYSDATKTRMVATYIPRVDTLWFSTPIDTLEGVTTPSDVAAPEHRFDDTKHRWIGYTAIATSRFQEYFSTGLDFTRQSEPLLVDVPSSARPATPDIAYVVPTFGWEKQETTNVKSSVRFGNGLRVYLHRPWFSSGDSELLGAILWNGSAPDYATREQFKPLFTQWGNDPIWKTGSIPDVPSISDFPGAVATATGLALEETSRPFDVAGHMVAYDDKRRLWYCDIEFSNNQSYMPFVRLALARYQPHSIQGVELSKVVLADYAQLTPDRSAVVSIDPVDPRRAQVFVGGLGPQAPEPSIIDVSVEKRLPKIVSDLAWEVAPTSEVTVTENSPDATEADAVLWSGSVQFAKTPPVGQYRIVIREFEQILVDGTEASDGVPFPGERLVYAAIIDYDYPGGS
jgi:hypothetical protein